MGLQTWAAESSPERGSARFAANDALYALASKDPRVVVLTCDNTQAGSPLRKLGDVIGPRLMDCGIAEQNMVGMAAGLALSGKQVVCQSFSCFLSQRALEFIYLDTAYNAAPVLFMATHAGVTSPASGPTHYSLMDLAYLRAMPNMIVLAPSDPKISAQLMEQALYCPKPVYMRLPKGVEPLVYKGDIPPISIGDAILARDGQDITLVGCGSMTYHCVRAAHLLEQEGIDARVIDLPTIKPLDEAILLAAAAETRGIITCEDHMISGGMGSAIAELLTAHGKMKDGARLTRLGIPDCFPVQGGTPEDIYARYGMDAAGIVRAAKAMLQDEIGTERG